MHALDLSYRQVAMRARDRLDDPSWSANVYLMATAPIAEFPRVRTLRGLALALDIPLATIVAACAESLELYVTPARGHDAQSGDSYDLLSPVELDADTERAIREALPKSTSSREESDGEPDTLA